MNALLHRTRATLLKRTHHDTLNMCSRRSRNERTMVERAPSCHFFFTRACSRRRLVFFWFGYFRVIDIRHLFERVPGEVPGATSRCLLDLLDRSAGLICCEATKIAGE